MIELLEGTFLDLGPGIWALIIVVSLFVIDLFQLGPHTFTYKQKRDKDGETKKSGCKRSWKGKRGGAAKRRKPKVIHDKTINNFIHVHGPCAIIVLSTGEEDFSVDSLVPEFSSVPSDAGSSAIQGQSPTVYPQSAEDLNNYVVARGDEAEVAALECLPDLWNAEERSNVRHLSLYSWKIPSTYALQKMVSLLDDLPGVDKVDLSVLYEEEDGEEEQNNLGEKKDYLRVHGITLEKIDLI